MKILHSLTLILGLPQVIGFKKVFDNCDRMYLVDKTILSFHLAVSTAYTEG